jgi:hypothetical protein
LIESAAKMAKDWETENLEAESTGHGLWLQPDPSARDLYNWVLRTTRLEITEI